MAALNLSGVVPVDSVAEISSMPTSKSVVITVKPAADPRQDADQ
jgi:hypothetical protein